MVGCVGVVGSKAEVIEQEVIDGMCRCDSVQRDHAGVGLLYSVSLGLPFVVRFSLNRKLRGINKAITPEAPSTGPYVSDGAHGIFEVTSFPRPYFHSHLYCRNEVLVSDRIHDKPSSHGICCQEDEIAITQNSARQSGGRRRR